MPRKSDKIQTDSTPDGDALDIVWGAQSIAKVLNTTPRRAFWLLETGKVPAKKIGKQWCASRSVLRSFFDDDVIDETRQRAADHARRGAA